MQRTSSSGLAASPGAPKGLAPLRIDAIGEESLASRAARRRQLSHRWRESKRESHRESHRTPRLGGAPAAPAGALAAYERSGGAEAIARQAEAAARSAASRSAAAARPVVAATTAPAAAVK